MKKLPVFAAIRHTLSLTFNNLGPAFRITWAWVIVFVVTITLFVWATAGLGRASDPAANLFPVMMFGTVFLLAAVAAMASIAVAWHRYILLDEGGDVGFNLRIDATVWRYAGNAILVAVGMMVVFGLPMVVLLQLSPYMLVLAFPAMFLVAPFMYRLMIKLPAIALENRDFSFSAALAVSRDNHWPLVGLVVMYFLVAFAINLFVGVVTFVGLIFGPFAVVIQVIATALAEWFGIIFGISLLTTLYGFFVEDRPL